LAARSYYQKTEVILFLVLFFSFAYFYQGGGANQNARFAQIRSIVEHGQLNINPFQISHDIVKVGQKIYPNKAPATSLVGVIPYFMFSRLKPILVHWFSDDFYHLFTCYVVTVLIVGLPCALGGVVFFRLLGLFHPAPWPRLICTLGLFLGTPAFAYSTVLYGHMVSTVLALVSFYLLYKYMCVEPDSPRSRLFIFLAGLSGGWAMVTEYPTAWIVFILSLYCFIRTFRLSKDWVSRLGLFVLGLVFPAGILLLYNYLVFKNPLFIAYFDKRGLHAAYKRGPVLGFSIAHRETGKALYETSFGPFRGFFHLSPFLILIFPGILYFSREKGKRGLLVTLWILGLVYFFLNAIYPYWYGGKALGPRHAMEMLPYLCLLSFFFIVRFPRFSSLLVMVSIFLMLSATSVRPEEYARPPFRNLYFPAFLSGNLSINRETTFQRNTVVSQDFNAFNLGEVAGLRGQLSLFPLYCLWLIGGFLMFKFGKKVQSKEAGRGYPAPSPAWVKWAVTLLLAILAIQIVNLVNQMQIRAYLEDLSGAGAYRVPSAEAPPPQVQNQISANHHLQIWEVLKPFSDGDTVKVKIQHAAAGRDGGFYIVAYGDKNQDGKPDVELDKSSFLTAKGAGDWSYWTFPATEGKLFVGNSWDDLGTRIFYAMTGWRTRDMSSIVYYSRQGPPVLSANPRSTNMTVEVIKEVIKEE